MLNPTTGILIALSLLGIAWLDSLPTPSCEPIKPTSKTEQQTTGPKNSCPTAIGFEITKIRASIHNNRDDITAVSTFVIAAFTVILGVFTVRLARSNRVAADAADLNARAAIAIELPVIRVGIDGLGFGASQQGDGPKKHYCAINHYLTFSNLGRTQAFPIEIECGWFAGDKLPDNPRYTFTKPFPMNTIYRADPEVTRELRIDDFTFETTADFYERLRTKTVSLWFFCSLAYLDFMQNRHDAGFCWERTESFGAGRFIADPTAAYNRKT